MNRFEDISESQVSIELPRGYRLEIVDGKITLLTPEGREIIRGAFASAAFRNGQAVCSSDPSARMQGGEDEIRIEVEGNRVRPALEWLIAWERRSPILRIIQIVTNTTERSLLLDQLVPLQAPRAFPDVSPDKLQVHSPGYMSWSAHSMGKLSELSYQADRVLAPMVDPTVPDGIPMSWVAHFSPEAESSSRMLVGFTQSYRHVGIVEVGRLRSSLLAWNDAEGVPLLPGERRQSEELLILLDMDLNDAMSKYAFEVARRKGIRKKPSDRPPVGWCSWSAYFENLTWQDIIENLKAANHLRRRLPLDYFQLDDFYTTVGDWLDMHDRFLGSEGALPDGPVREQAVGRRMEGLAGMIRQQGLTAGLWLAPLLVNQHSKLFRRLGENSKWLVRDELGEPINAVTNWGGPNYVLDVTHPQAEAYVRRVIRTVSQGWGFKLLKLDYLFAGALHGERGERDMTSVEAYNYFLKIVREEAMDAQVIFCGAPFIESAGGDYIRIGPDVADRSGPQWYPADRENPSSPAAANGVCESLTRAFWLESLYMHVDSDSLILRVATNSKINPAERETIIAAVRATNSLVSFGDDLLELNEYQKNLMPRALSASSQAGRPAFFDNQGRPVAVQVRIAEDQQEVTLVNWSDEETELTFDPEQFEGLRGWQIAVEDILNGEWLGVGTGELKFSVPAHGVKVLKVLKVSIPNDGSNSNQKEGSDRDLA